MKAYRKEAMDYLMSYTSKPHEQAFGVAMGQLCLFVKDEQEHFEQKHKPKIEKLKATTKDVTVKTACENLLNVAEGKE